MDSGHTDTSPGTLSAPGREAPPTTDSVVQLKRARHTPLRPALGGFVAGLAAAAALVVLLYGTLSAAVGELRAGWEQVGLTETIALMLLFLVTGGAATCGAFLWWQVERLLTLRGYLRGLHAALSADLARHAPIHRYGFAERGLPFAPDGQALGDLSEPLAQRLPRTRATLILGDHGIGKTTTLRACALYLAQSRRLLSIALGHTPLPILISLPEYAAASNTNLLELAARQLISAGAPVLGARLARSLARWHVLMLCDGLDELLPADRERVASDLGALADGRLPLLRVAVTCDLACYTETLAAGSGLIGLRAFDRVVATGLTPQDLSHVLARAVRARQTASRSASQVAAQLRESGIGAQCSHPATLTAALTVLAARESLPPGRACLLLRSLTLLLDSAPRDAASRQRTLDLLSRLAAFTRGRHVTLIAVHPGQSTGSAVSSLLASGTESLEAEGSQPTNIASPDPGTEDAVTAALTCGILEWLPDHTALRFASRSLESALAALWLAQHSSMDELLADLASRPEWAEPLIIWAAHTHQASGSLTPLLALVAPLSESDPDAPPAWINDAPPEPAFDVLAPLLAATLEAVVPALDAAISETDAAALRTILDRVAASAQEPEARSRFADAFMRVERESQMDLTGHLAALVASSAEERLVRAQATGILATLPSPTAARAVATLLGQRDPVLRLALDQALPAASPEVYAALQDAVSSGGEYERHRAAEALALGGPAAQRVAEAGLSSADPRLRTASARALGVLRSAGARDALLALLADPVSAVRAAAARALGHLADTTLAPELAPHLASADPETRAAVAAALGELRAASAVPALHELLADTDAQVRLAAATALGKIGDEHALRALRDRSQDDDPLMQATVAAALRRLGAT